MRPRRRCSDRATSSKSMPAPPGASGHGSACKLASMRKLAIVLACITGIWLVAMVVVSLVTGATQEAHEHFALPEPYAASLLEHPGALRLVFAMDIAFTALYTAFFVAFAGYLRGLGRPFVNVALGFMLACAAL